MFTGIINSVLPIHAIIKNLNCHTHTIKFPQHLLTKLTIGSSISYNGCCLTVSNIQNNLVNFDIIKSTLELTNIKNLQPGDLVNIERAARFGSEISGHLIFGHIICTAEIKNIIFLHNQQEMHFKIYNNKYNVMKYILNKGSIGIDGVSLTINNVVKNCFCIYLTPHTLKYTTFKKKKIGDIVNIEIDMYIKGIIDTVEKKLNQCFSKQTLDALK